MSRPPNTMVTVTQLATIADCDRSTVTRAVAAGNLTPTWTHPDGRLMLFAWADAERWIANRGGAS